MVWAAIPWYSVGDITVAFRGRISAKDYVEKLGNHDPGDVVW
jgi:hypothetical protein